MWTIAAGRRFKVCYMQSSFESQLSVELAKPQSTHRFDINGLPSIAQMSSHGLCPADFESFAEFCGVYHDLIDAGTAKVSWSEGQAFYRRVAGAADHPTPAQNVTRLTSGVVTTARARFQSHDLAIAEQIHKYALAGETKTVCTIGVASSAVQPSVACANFNGASWASSDVRIFLHRHGPPRPAGNAMDVAETFVSMPRFRA